MNNNLFVYTIQFSIKGKPKSLNFMCSADFSNDSNERILTDFICFLIRNHAKSIYFQEQNESIFANNIKLILTKEGKEQNIPILIDRSIQIYPPLD